MPPTTGAHTTLIVTFKEPLVAGLAGEPGITLAGGAMPRLAPRQAAAKWCRVFCAHWQRRYVYINMFRVAIVLSVKAADRAGVVGLLLVGYT